MRRKEKIIDFFPIHIISEILCGEIQEIEKKYFLVKTKGAKRFRFGHIFNRKGENLVLEREGAFLYAAGVCVVLKHSDKLFF